jgi:release factor glutamine methyltransferase
MSDMFVRDAVAWAEARFNEAGIDSAHLDAELLAAWTLGVERISILLLPHRTLTSDEDQRFRLAVARRAMREPFAYIVGSREFWSLPFMVTRDTLIPRPESETLIDVAVRALTFDPPKRILDLGTGSGCLLLAALSEFPDATGLGVDASMAALTVAIQNGHALALADRAVWELGDWDQEIEPEQQFDLILSNPPYIAEHERPALMPDVRDHEPAAALFAGVDGLDCYKQLMPVISRRLTEAGLAILEIGSTQADAVTLLSQSAGFVTKRHPDLSGHIRALSLRRKTV